MASASKIGRNQQCPCGSGEKYKNCCAKKTGQISQTNRVLLALLALGVVAALALAFQSSRGRERIPTCPPGQSWSAAHGHCH